MTHFLSLCYWKWILLFSSIEQSLSSDSHTNQGHRITSEDGLYKNRIIECSCNWKEPWQSSKVLNKYVNWKMLLIMKKMNFEKHCQLYVNPS